jgi:hypothetical protein
MPPVTEKLYKVTLLVLPSFIEPLNDCWLIVGILRNKYWAYPTALLTLTKTVPPDSTPLAVTSEPLLILSLIPWPEAPIDPASALELAVSTLKVIGALPFLGTINGLDVMSKSTVRLTPSVVVGVAWPSKFTPLYK